MLREGTDARVLSHCGQMRRRDGSVGMGKRKGSDINKRSNKSTRGRFRYQKRVSIGLGGGSGMKDSLWQEGRVGESIALSRGTIGNGETKSPGIRK